LVVADGVRGKLFKVDRSAKKLVEAKDFINSEARLYKMDFISETLGNKFQYKRLELLSDTMELKF